MPLYGTVELGGTKTLVSVGTEPDDLAEPLRIPTTEPKQVLSTVIDYLAEHELDGIGVASFGPVELRLGHEDFGVVTDTPKPGWRKAPILATIREALTAPVRIDTDVNGAALGEGRWGAATGLTEYVYLTIGTGIGGGAVDAGETLGRMVHPEMGHVVVERHPDDLYEGRCPYHGSCLEGMAAGPALQDRFGPFESWVDPKAPLELAVHYISQGLRNIVYILAPERIIVGGGVSKITGFHEALRAALTQTLRGYPGLAEHVMDDFVVPPGLGDLSGLAGGLVLASRS